MQTKSLEFKKKYRNLLIIFFLAFATVGIYFFSKTSSTKVLGVENSMYSIQLTSNGQLKKNDGRSESSFINKIDGVLNRRLLERKNGFVRVGYQLSPAKIAINQEEIPPKLLEIYTAFFIVEYQQDGSIHSYYFPNWIAKDDENYLKSLVEPIILVAKDGNTEWTAKEFNNTGEFLVRYEKSENLIHKSKVKYLSVENTSEGMQLPEVIQSQSTFDKGDTNDWFHKIDTYERVKIGFQGQDIEVISSFHANGIDFKPDKSLTIWDNRSFDEYLNEFHLQEKNKVSLAELTKKYLLEAKYEKKTLNDLVDKIKSNKQLSWDELEQIKEYLDVYPSEASKIPDLILKADLQDRVKSQIIHALELSGTPEAQKALVSIKDNSAQTRMNRIRAIVGMNGLKKPTIDSIESLKETYRKRQGEDEKDYSNTSLLALGNLAYTQKKKEGITSSTPGSIGSFLKEELHSNGDKDKTAIVLEGIGNSRDPSLFEDVKPFMKSEDPDVRKSAANATRFMNNPEVLNTLVNNLQAETDSGVRGAIVQSMANNEPTPVAVETVQNVVVKEPLSTTRTDMLNYLSDNRENYPNVKKTFEELIKVEPSEANRDLLFKGLYSKQNPEKKHNVD